MTHLGADAEEALENATLALFAELGWETVNGYHEVTSETPDAGTGGPYLGRAARYEVVLRPRLEAALTRLNPDLPSEALHQAVVELTRDRSAMTNEEEQRHIAENLTEAGLAVFDILTRPGPDLTEKEKREAKRIARELLTTLSREKLVLDWRKRQQSRAAVRVAIEDTIWRLPECYTDEMCRQKSAQVYQHVYDNYWGAGQSVYAMAE